MAATIRRVTYFRAVSPLTRPIADATHAIGEIAFVVTRVELDNGVEGESNLLAFAYSPQALAGALRDVGPLALGLEPHETGRFLERARRESEYFGNEGVNRWAEGAINVAMWDAWGKALGQPVWKLLGTCREAVPVYGSGGWLSYATEDLLEEVRGYVRRGFRAVKVKVGSPELERDVERLRQVRAAVGPRVRIMMDANQGLDLAGALELARRVRDLGIHWFEEPLRRTDWAGYAQLRRQAGVSLAMGEREYDTTALVELARREALDLWQPDLLRLGGVEGWRASALTAGALHLPVLPHYSKEYDVPLLCTIPNGQGAEWFDWVDGLVDTPLQVVDGLARPLPGPGWGFRFRDAFLTELP